MTDFKSIISLALLLFAIYGLVTTAGIISERSGIVNIGLNGNVIAGVLASLLFHGVLDLSKEVAVNQEDAKFGIDLASLLISGLFGVVISYLFSIATITLKGDHVIVGTAMNILMPVVAFIVLYLDATNTGFFTPVTTPGKVAEIRMAAEGGFDWRNIVYFGIALVLMASAWAMIRFTKVGLRIWASGENPHALAAAGVNVHRTRYFAQMIVGFLAGVAGAMYLKLNNGSFTGDVGGIGFFALAMLVISQWRIHWAALVAVVFALIQSTLITMQVKLPVTVPKEFLEMLPFVLPLVVLPFFNYFKKISNVPKHDGLIYDAGQR